MKLEKEHIIGVIIGSVPLFIIQFALVDEVQKMLYLKNCLTISDVLLSVVGVYETAKQLFYTFPVTQRINQNGANR